MSDSLHCVTLAEKIFETDISIFDFELFDDNSYLPPLSAINETEASFVDLGLKLEFVPFDLNV